ncbi:hypothetical protein KR018_008906, partial [Drosophila ironensis]
MAWVPNSRFEDDLVALQPDFDLIHGQLAYEERRRREHTPRPQVTYDFLSARHKRNGQVAKGNGERGGPGREVRESLRLMEKIQSIAGTKPLGEHATLADWKDTSNVERETIAMMRHFGMMSMAVDLPAGLQPPELPASSLPAVQFFRCGRRTIPYITDPDYFRPRRTRRGPQDADDTTTDSFHTAESGSSCGISPYGSAHSRHNTSEELEKEVIVEIPYQTLENSFTDGEQQPPNSADNRKRN